MNYLKIYKNIIKQAKSEQRRKYPTNNPNYRYFEEHHIIPRTLCKNKSWKNSKYNLVLLTAREHYICHQLLTKIFPNNANLIYACFFMANKKKGEHINSKMYQWIRENYSKIHANNMRIKNKDKSFPEQAYINYKIWRTKHKQEISQRMMGSKNIIHKEGVLAKIRQKKTNTIIQGKNMDKIAAEKAANTMKKEYINEQGQITTIYKETGKKNSKYWNEEITIGEETLTRVQFRNRKNHQTQRNNGKWYLLKNVFNPEFEQRLCASEIRKISAGLPNKTRENYLGKSKDGKTKLIKSGKEELIGLYCIFVTDSSTTRNKNMKKKERLKKYNRIIKNPWVKIFNKNKQLEEILPKEIAIKNYGKYFCKCTIENPYGSIKTYSKERLKNKNFIGYYCEIDTYEKVKHLVDLDKFF